MKDNRLVKEVMFGMM